jgi:outer membrane lipoprotein SlyB
MNNEVASALRGLYDRFGEQILTQPPRLASLLRDECPERRPEISALVKALEEQVPQDLLNSHSGEPPRSLAARLSKRLSEEHLLAPTASSWAVWAWAHGLGLGDEYRNEERSELVDPRPVTEPFIEPAPNPSPNPLPVPGPQQSIVIVRQHSWPLWIAAAVLLIVGFVVAQKTVFKSPEPPHIATIDVPKNVRVGKPYVFTVHFDSAPAGVVAVERHVVDSTAQWDEPTSNLKVTGMNQLNQGEITYSFNPETKPSKSTLQFVLIDSKGQRSAPQTVSYEILPPALVCNVCGTVASVQKIDEKRTPRGVGAAVGAVVGGVVGRVFGKGSRGKNVATAGGAVAGGFAGNAIEGHMSTTHWEVTLKMSGGRRQVVSYDTEPMWQVGQKVKWIDGEIIAAE